MSEIFGAGMGVLIVIAIIALVLLALTPLFFLIDMYRFVRKIANSSMQQEEYLRKLVVIARKYYQRDFGEAEQKKDSNENNDGVMDENASNNPGTSQ